MKAVTVALALLHRDGRWFLQRRALDAGHLPGFWEFPGGKVEPGESPETGLIREVREELDWRPGPLVAMEPITHAYADRVVTLHPFRALGPDQPRTALAWGWFTAVQARRLKTPEANASLITALEHLP